MHSEHHRHKEIRSSCEKPEDARCTVRVMSNISHIGCAVCAELIAPDDDAIELLSTIEFDDPIVLDEPLTMQARPAYVHARCGVPAGDVEVRHDLMRGLRP
jgi:hypothetical protein